MMDKESMAVVQPPKVSRLAAEHVFGRLSPREKMYAHHMARAAWQGTRIILRQVSPESAPIYDFIMELYRTCDGNWERLATQTGLSRLEMDQFLNYAAMFLANIGNYYGHGDQKFTPILDKSQLESLSAISAYASQLYGQFADTIASEYPSSLGFPSNLNQSAYYTGMEISREEIAIVNRVLEQNSIYAENTRIHKSIQGALITLEVLQASAAMYKDSRVLMETDELTIRLRHGDHAEDLLRICKSLREAEKFVASGHQKQVLTQYQRSFESGDVEIYRDAQKTWVKDVKPAVESILGFVEPYRDPFGSRAEFEGLVAIVDENETKDLTRLVAGSAVFIRRLPWVGEYDNEGNGPFERDLFEAPDFTSLHVLAYCSSIIFLGINLPNYNDIRQTVGFKNIMVANRNQRLTAFDVPPFISASDAPAYTKHAHIAWKLQITLHELFGHGTGKLLIQSSAEDYNFDINNLPIDPLTDKRISLWYKPGETWNSVFGDIAASVDECRAETVGSFLMADKEMLKIFGFTDTSEVNADDLVYNIYLQLGVLGLLSLESYTVEDAKWGQAHDRGHFAMFRILLGANSFMTIDCDSAADKLTVSIDRSKILSHGKAALSSFLLRLHIYRCTADVNACRTYYENLTRLDDTILEWRRIVIKNKRPKQIFVQANTFVKDGEAKIKEYEATVQGLIQSWAERSV